MGGGEGGFGGFGGSGGLCGGAGGLEGKALVESMFSQLWLVLSHKIIFDQGEISSVLTITKDSLADVNKGID